MTDKIVVLVTCGSLGEARKIGRSLVEQKLVACANIFQSPVRSIYRWRGKVQTAKEFLVILKTSRRHFAAVERAVKSLHTYEVPEIVALPMADGSGDYLEWISESVGGARRKES